MTAAILDRQHSIAEPHFNRYQVPTAALAVHLCIGQAYAFSTFNIPLTKLVGITQSAPDDWKTTEVTWIFTLAIVVLGSSAGLFGRWVERVGPRQSMFTAACCFGGGFLLAAVGLKLHQLWLVYLGYGVLGGCGLGIGYISPVSTLMKWFPDRPGMATGMAIMGFGGGALVAAPLSVLLMEHFKSATSNGVFETFVTLGVIYFLFMMIGVVSVRVPPPDWKPAGWTPSLAPQKMISTNHVAVDVAWKTPQFWLLWGVLCMNVSAGIGILGVASPMIQEIFAGKVTAQSASGFVGLLSLFNMAGRFVWASTSDYIGRRNTYMVFFVLGIILYASAPSLGEGLFVAACCLILSMYGGGFATIPAYLRDMFGTYQVGAIHGRLITAWSVAALLGQLMTYIREAQIAHGVSKVQAYSGTLYIMAGLLFVGFLCNLAMRPVDARYHYHGDLTRDAVGGH